MRREERCLNRNFILKKIPNYMSEIETGLLETDTYIFICLTDQVDIRVFILFIDGKNQVYWLNYNKKELQN